MGSRSVHTLFILIVLCTSVNIFSQGSFRITHLSGTKKINGIDVTVTKAGKADSLHYCGNDDGPYYLGYNYSSGKAGDGSYTFTFSKPVEEVSINLSALSHNLYNYNEHARFYVNEKHYSVTQVGRKNSCGEEQVIITEMGDVAPCNNCSASGTNGIKIRGPITSFTLECDIITGEPMGFVAGIWMKGMAMMQETVYKYKSELNVSASGESESLLITGDMEKTSVDIFDKNNTRMPINYESITKEKLVLNLKDYPAGEYKLQLIKNGEVENQQLTIP